MRALVFEAGRAAVREVARPKLKGGFAHAVAVFQVAIALGAVAALTKSRPVWLGSLFLGAGGLVLFAVAILA